MQSRVYHNCQLETKQQLVSQYPSGCGVHVNNSENELYKLHLVHLSQTEAFKCRTNGFCHSQTF